MYSYIIIYYFSFASFVVSIFKRVEKKSIFLLSKIILKEIEIYATILRPCNLFD